ncbi:hypothetical protein [Brevibacillus sp. 179-C 1.1 NHS]|uniref:hypothetical protein n=1 Tax=Brevibacillus sp. 179-C 1.1 NHS TaxID=3235177 RepID=UPI0039A35411
MENSPLPFWMNNTSLSSLRIAESCADASSQLLFMAKPFIHIIAILTLGIRTDKVLDKLGDKSAKIPKKQNEVGKWQTI